MCYAAVPLSVDHKPNRSDERQRIEQAGGFVIWAGKFHPIWMLPFVFMVHNKLMITMNNLLVYRNMEGWRYSCCFPCIWRQAS